MANDNFAGYRLDIAIFVSLLIAVLLGMLNYPDSVQHMIPNWTLLIVIYWCLVAPEQVSVFTAWGIGMVVDILDLTILGQHALVFAAVGMIAIIASPKVIASPLWLQCAFILVMSILATAFQIWINHLAFDYEYSPLNWQSGVAAALMWPLLRIALDKVRNCSHPKE